MSASQRPCWAEQPRSPCHLERVRAYRNTEAYRKALRKRAVWIEPLFALSRGVARVERLQTKEAREGELRGAYDRVWAERHAAPVLREQRPEESGSGGRSPASGSRPSRVSWCPKTSREMHMGPSGTFFNRLVLPYSIS